MGFSKVLVLFFTSFTPTLIGQENPNIQQKQAIGHPMQYFLSTPFNWNRDKKWPVIIILEAAEKEYKANLEKFIYARGELPFILVAPIHTGNGNQGRRDPKHFPYTTETWDYIDKVGDCEFNVNGIHQIMKEVKLEFNGEPKFYITGFEAGTHLLWSFVFNHPEDFYAAVPVAGNYRGRCVDIKNISNNREKELIEIMAFFGEKDVAFGPNGPNFDQWTEPKNIALKNGFKKINETIIPDLAHVPMPSEVLSFFNLNYQKLKN